MEKPYLDRVAAGRALAARLKHLADRPDVVVLGLVRGGVPVAAVVATELRVQLDVLVVRKLGVPSAPELAFGAIGPDGVQVLNPEISERIEPERIAEVVRAETAELRRREEVYRPGRSPLDLRDRTVVIVDDGLATGATIRAAVVLCRQLHAHRIMVAVPVGSVEACAVVSADADELLCLLRPADFHAVGQFYENFEQVSDEQVTAMLTERT
ncbi:Predicted phosphoribosyltransferase [Micromonospora pattaloongensis]|uniref:Predicted phosphoribosyltransferase n=1 Tax=Micromonospora pattaloongensis TaxID=405436 RepID=A0A1H3HSS0_9ACTN|nr:phosphoribosyltransferase family protein [Micromonospora pattaloongensis]SDY18482.1 Predicted phosphoribosyltransferase [Micromonospora pattaloongensis]